MVKGVIYKALSGFYYVKTDEGMIECRARGKFRAEKLSPLVGDDVLAEVTEPGKGTVTEILPRRNFFVRPSVANIDALVMVVSAAIPVTDPFLIDRISAIAELKGCESIICINKCDIEAGDELYDIYSSAGFTAVKTSAVTGEGIDELGRALQGKRCAFTGNSGVGKSSLLNALHPGFDIMTADVSQKLGRGRHTTRHIELFELAGGAVVADTPGFSSFDTEEINLELKEKLPYLFREFRPYLGSCFYNDCAHVKEQGCAVLEALNNGSIKPSRHKSYVRLFEQLKDLREWNQKNK
jgi:ribosome biogenesis GTPase